MATPEGLCTKCSVTQYCEEHAISESPEDWYVESGESIDLGPHPLCKRCRGTGEEPNAQFRCPCRWSRSPLRPAALSLCDRTGVMVQPWLEAGYDCYIVDTRHPRGVSYEGQLVRVGCDVRYYGTEIATSAPSIVFAFPPCTHLAGSGARWFADKGLESLHEALGLVVACKRICEASGAPWMLENPVGTLSSYWRTPDYTFQPWQYGDRYTKKTCLWTGGGFVMPAPWIAHKPADVKASIHLMPPSADRADKRSITPAGFARAVFEANEPIVRQRRTA